MRILILLLLAFVSIGASGQTRPPLKVEATNIYPTTADRAEREGIDIPNAMYTYPSNYPFNGTATPATSGSAAGSASAPVTVAGFSGAKSQAMYVSGIFITTSEAVNINIRLGDANSAYRGIINGQQYFPVNRVLYGGQATSLSSYGKLNNTTGGHCDTGPTDGVSVRQ